MAASPLQRSRPDDARDWLHLAAAGYQRGCGERYYIAGVEAFSIISGKP
jgi:hypothetical protein